MRQLVLYWFEGLGYLSELKIELEKGFDMREVMLNVFV